MSVTQRVLLFVGMFGSVLQSGCMSYHQIESGDLSGLDEVRITMASGKQEQLRDPQQVNHTVSGLTLDGDTARIPTADIEKIEVGENSARKAVGWIAVGVAGTAVAAGFVSGLAALLDSFDDMCVLCGE